MTATPARRTFLAGAALVTLLPLTARATPESMAAAIREVTGGRKPRAGRVTLDIPPLVENGSTVPVSVSVESPMTAADHVTAIHVFNEKNPQPHVFHAFLNPRSGKAAISTRIKLGDSQRVIAIAEMSDGTLWSDGADVIVTIAACLEDPT
jgi:sulfur-oxidizing protein SoxY